MGDEVQLTIEQGSGEGLVIKRSGDLLHIPDTLDLTARACRAFYNHAGIGNNWTVNIHVNKSTPEQAGLGGGSSNAATVLKLLQQHHEQALSTEKLLDIAVSLGADVPFFLQDQCAFVEGIGETIAPIKGITGHLIVYKPPLSCATAKIFSDPQLTRQSSDVKIAVFDSARRTNSDLFEFLNANTHNALQAVVERTTPEWKKQFFTFFRCVNEFKPQLVRMSGSGSAMFAVFASPSQLSNAVAAVAEAPELKVGKWFECHIQNSQVENRF